MSSLLQTLLAYFSINDPPNVYFVALRFIVSDSGPFVVRTFLVAASADVDPLREESNCLDAGPWTTLLSIGYLLC